MPLNRRTDVRPTPIKLTQAQYRDRYSGLEMLFDRGFSIRDCAATMGMSQERVLMMLHRMGYQRIRSMSIEEVLSAPASPWQRAYVERLIGSIHPIKSRFNRFPTDSTCHGA
jgi:hypothetical protein